MSAVISDKVMMKEVLKATGFDCPDGMENRTFEEATSGGGSGGSDFLGAYKRYIGQGYMYWVCSSKEIVRATYEDTIDGNSGEFTVVDPHCVSGAGNLGADKFSLLFADGQEAEIDTIIELG